MISNNGFFKVITENIEDLRRALLRILYPFLAVFVIFLMFDLRNVNFFNFKLYFIYPDPYKNMGAQFLSLLISHTISKKFELLAIKPTDGVVADLYSCLFLSFMFTSPNISYQIGSFIGPALKKEEKQVVKKVFYPGLSLFIFGSFIGVYFISPLLFDILYDFDLGVGAVPSMSITSFVSFFLIYVISFGLAFETPVIMFGLSSIGIVDKYYWRRNWRYAVVAALIFGVIFSPGVTGFTMMLLAIPIIALYFGGMLITEKYAGNFRKNQNDQT
ncbi:twin-arginine translocase subunit TatC [Caldiplasma sukawensis]